MSVYKWGGAAGEGLSKDAKLILAVDIERQLPADVQVEMVTW